MEKNEKPSETEMAVRLQPGAVLLDPLVVSSSSFQEGGSDRPDARVELGMPGETQRFRFVVEAKTRATPQAVQLAKAKAKAAVGEGEWPMIHVPYLSPERLEELEREQVSGVDLCGNGVVIVPGRLLVLRTGQPNKYRDSRPLSNPYRGRSAMVARLLLSRPRWDSLKELTAAIRAAGATLSLPQTSKAIRALEEEMLVSKSGGVITLTDPLRLLDKLGAEWRTPLIRTRQALRLPAGEDWASALSSSSALEWAVTGESSVSRYAMFSQGGARRIAVSSAQRAMTLLGGSPESVPNFADVELLETEEPGYYFNCETDERGIRWASALQTWLELRSGDARQQEAARELRSKILAGVKS